MMAMNRINIATISSTIVNPSSRRRRAALRKTVRKLCTMPLILGPHLVFLVLGTRSHELYGRWAPRTTLLGVARLTGSRTGVRAPGYQDPVQSAGVAAPAPSTSPRVTPPPPATSAAMQNGSPTELRVLITMSPPLARLTVITPCEAGPSTTCQVRSGSNASGTPAALKPV